MYSLSFKQKRRFLTPLDYFSSFVITMRKHNSFPIVKPLTVVCIFSRKGELIQKYSEYIAKFNSGCYRATRHILVWYNPKCLVIKYRSSKLKLLLQKASFSRIFPQQDFLMVGLEILPRQTTAALKRSFDSLLLLNLPLSQLLVCFLLPLTMTHIAWLSQSL